MSIEIVKPSLAPRVQVPPRGLLSAASTRWWSEVAGKYVLESHHLELLTQAAMALDRITSAQRALKADGEYYLNKQGERRAHPALAVASQASMAYAKLLRQLDLDVEAPQEVHRRLPNLGRRGR